MMSDVPTQLQRLIASVIGEARAERTLQTLQTPAALERMIPPAVHRSVLAMALNAVLFEGLLNRAPTAAAYVEDVRAQGGKILFDHGALRTIRFGDGPTGKLPPGRHAFSRLLEPIGYRLAGVYPLERLGMTGYAFRHLDLPEDIPQFFVSELHVERFSAPFQAAAHRVFDGTRDPVDEAARAALRIIASDEACSLAAACAALASLAAAFGRWHPTPTLEDYEALLGESVEAAWIATEGSAFNHATDRVPSVEAVAEAQRRLGRPIKAKIESSSDGRVRQTAFRADPVEREFRTEEGLVRRVVPGSFYEFITRESLRTPEPGPSIDLSFDSGNAQGIFKMTEPA